MLERRMKVQWELKLRVESMMEIDVGVGMM
jgi:hypothetical protein